MYRLCAVIHASISVTLEGSSAHTVYKVSHLRLVFSESTVEMLRCQHIFFQPRVITRRIARSVDRLKCRLAPSFAFPLPPSEVMLNCLLSDFSSVLRFLLAAPRTRTQWENPRAEKQHSLTRPFRDPPPPINILCLSPASSIFIFISLLFTTYEFVF
jgi:hypothetical protein